MHASVALIFSTLLHQLRHQLEHIRPRDLEPLEHHSLGAGGDGAGEGHRVYGGIAVGGGAAHHGIFYDMHDEAFLQQVEYGLLHAHVRLHAAHHDLRASALAQLRHEGVVAAATEADLFVEGGAARFFFQGGEHFTLFLFGSFHFIFSLGEHWKHEWASLFPPPGLFDWRVSVVDDAYDD